MAFRSFRAFTRHFRRFSRLRSVMTIAGEEWGRDGTGGGAAAREHAHTHRTRYSPRLPRIAGNSLAGPWTFSYMLGTLRYFSSRTPLPTVGRQNKQGCREARARDYSGAGFTVCDQRGRRRQEAGARDYSGAGFREIGHAACAKAREARLREARARHYSSGACFSDV